MGVIRGWAWQSHKVENSCELYTLKYIPACQSATVLLGKTKNEKPIKQGRMCIQKCGLSPSPSSLVDIVFYPLEEVGGGAEKVWV